LPSTNDVVVRCIRFPRIGLADLHDFLAEAFLFRATPALNGTALRSDEI
jgi:hypothetical protein